jgi:DNA-binding protein
LNIDNVVKRREESISQAIDNIIVQNDKLDKSDIPNVKISNQEFQESSEILIKDGKKIKRTTRQSRTRLSFTKDLT